MIIAHRGESFLAPENTLAAIKLAWAKGAKAVEIDVHLSNDYKIIVIHDNNTKRVGNKNINISSASLAELKTVDVGFKKGPEWAGEQIPTLIEIIQTIPPYGKLVIEIKCGPEIIQPLSTVLKSFTGTNSQIEIICFNFKVLSLAKKIMPNYKMLWLLNLDYYLPHWLIFINPNKLIQKLQNHQLDGINVWAGKTLTKEFVMKFTSRNFMVYTWTVDEVAKAQTLFGFGVNAVTSNRASWLTNKLSQN